MVCPICRIYVLFSSVAENETLKKLDINGIMCCEIRGGAKKTGLTFVHIA